MWKLMGAERNTHETIIEGWAGIVALQSAFFLHLKIFFYTSEFSSNSQNTIWLFKETHGHYTSKIMSSEVEIYDFRKSK